MTNILKNAQGAEIPARPTLDNNDVRKLVIRNAVDGLFSSKYCPFEDHEKQDLINSLDSHYYQHIDEYDLAKYFEDDNWDVNRDFISNLEQVTGCIETQIRKSEQDWAEAYKPVPPLPLGARVDVGHHKSMPEYGTIEELSKYSPATYAVRLDSTPADSTTRRLIKFEDAKEAA